METQFKKIRFTEKEDGSNEPLLKTREFKMPMVGNHLADIISREKKKHFGTKANSVVQMNILPQGTYFWINRIGPDSLVENRPAWVEFSIWNMGEPLQNAFVRAKIEPRQSVTSYAGTFQFPIRYLDHGESLDGAISFQLPRADYKNVITLELCKWGDIPEGGEFPPLNVITSDKIEFDVAARFTIHFQGIWIRETASHHEDTVFASLSGQMENTSWGDAASLGEHNNITSRSGLQPNLLPVGPFDMIPGSGKSIALSCVIANAGHTSTEEDAKKALEVVSAVGAVVATTVMSIIFPVGAGVWAALSEGVNEMHKAIIEWALADCDTVVLNDARLINEQDLFLFTFDANDRKTDAIPASWSMRSQKKAGQYIIDPPVLGGGCRDSDYTATLSLQRHRAPEIVHDYSVDGIQLGPDQLMSFGRVSPTGDPVIFALESGSNGIQPDGLYKAPSVRTDKKFEIIKWTTYVSTKKGIFPFSEDFTVVVLD